MKHKHLKTIAIILLNVLSSAIFLWFFATNCFLRPSSGNLFKEFFSGFILIGTVYINYFLLYPKLFLKGFRIYWLMVVLIAILVGVVDLCIAYPYIASRNAQLVELIGPYAFYSRILFFAIGRNFALNIFPYLFRERQHLRHSLEKEREIVYERVRMLDVTDKNSDIQLISIDEIFYCQQQRNFTVIYTVQNKSYTRLGSMKHLEQLFGEEEFIRITTTLLVPFQYIQSCQDNVVVMRKMPWEKNPTAFQLEPKTRAEITERIAEFMRLKDVVLGGKEGVETSVSTVGKRKPASPPDEKIREVLSYIENHANCHSADIIAGTKYSLSTIERCLSELRKQGMIEHVGSRKHGGYCVPNNPQDGETSKDV